MKRRLPFGFSLIEVLFVILLTVFGFLGILTLQVRSVQAVADAKDTMLATTFAGHFVETVKVEALQWQNDGALDLNQAHFKYLSHADGLWHAAYPDAGGGTGVVGRLGNANEVSAATPLEVTSLDRGVLTEFAGQIARFCVFYRLTPIVPDVVLRLETRVMFRTTDGLSGPGYSNCNVDGLTNMVRDRTNVVTVSALTPRVPTP